MQKDRLRFWIIFGVCCVSLFLICTIFIFGFRAKTVYVEFRARLPESETMIQDSDRVEIKKYIPLGKNLMTENFDDEIKLIEADYPFVKVSEIVRGFPGTVRVYISERIPKYRILSDDKWAILDSDFKVLVTLSDVELHIENGYGKNSYYDKTIEIDNTSLIYENVKIGSFLTKNDTIKNFANDICSGIYGRARDYFIARKIVISNSGDDYNFTIVMKNDSAENGEGCSVIVESKDDLIEKVFAGISTFEEEIGKNPSINNSSSVIKIVVSDGKYIGYRYSV